MGERDDLEREEPQPSSRAPAPTWAQAGLGRGAGAGRALLPPYEGRQTEMKDGYEEHVEKVFHGADDVDPAPAALSPTRSAEGVGPTDTEATSALGVGVGVGVGVGESINRHGEDVAKQEDEPGRDDTGTKGHSDRPTGTSDERASPPSTPTRPGAHTRWAERGVPGEPGGSPGTVGRAVRRALSATPGPARDPARRRRRPGRG